MTLSTQHRNLQIWNSGLSLIFPGIIVKTHTQIIVSTRIVAYENRDYTDPLSPI